MTALDPVQDGAAGLVPEPGEAVRLPAIRVRIDPDEAARFLRETGGAGTGDFVPLTFPFRWLALPEIRGLILQLIGEGFLPVHEAQSFVYEKSLRIGAEYVLSVEIFRKENPSRLTLKMTVSTGEGEICAHLETTLRLVRLSAGTPS